MATSVGSTVVPSLENHFGLDIGNEVHSESTGLVLWRNPHLDSAITPYIPSETDEAILSAFQAAFNTNNQQPLELTSSGEWLFLNHDVAVIILCQLDLKSVVHSSEVNKSLYLAAKQDIIWHKQLWNLLPSVNAIPSNLCVFSPQQQFQIIYRKIKDESKPYQAKFDRTLSVINNNLNGIPLANIGRDGFTLQMMMTITPELGRLNNAINVLIPAEFNNQKKFEEVIRHAEVVKNITSAINAVTVEDVTDLAEPNGKGA